ncbi:hypothetical protein [Saccharopolyspora halophila]|uniref:hypothetical protein n=1 Tax=Saccharopolyspora halophila TaxID=405551 RepID=UPI0031D474FA
MSSERRAGDSPAAGGRRSLLAWRVASALLLLAMGGIHLYLVISGTGGLLGALFVVNALGSLVLAVAMVGLHRRLLLTSVLSLLLMAGTLLALVIALTPAGLFGLRSSLSYQLAPTSLVVESVGVLVLAVTAVLVFRERAD